MSTLLRDRPPATPAMLAVFDDEALLRAALRFEAALAQAQMEAGLMGQTDARAVAAACAEIPDAALLAEQAAHAGTLAIPLITLLRGRVAAAGGDASQVHRGATSQDVADTALVLQAREAAALISRDAYRLSAALAALAAAHAATPMVGRTLLQAALPITFGLKVAGWMVGIDAALARFEREAAGLRLQFGGASGSLAGLGAQAFTVEEKLAALLDLAPATLPWHACRESLAGLGAALAILAGAVGKIARDIALLAQTEIAEAFEPHVAGRGGSSAMAHKRNPTGCQVALSAALRAPHLAATLVAGLPQEHERGIGGWQADIPVLAQFFEIAHGALAAMVHVAEGLEVDIGRMAANLQACGIGTDTGMSTALVARALAGHEAAHTHRKAG